MASVITSSIPTETIFDLSTLTSLSTFRTRIRSTQVTTLTSEFIDIDDDGDLITVTSEIEEDVVSTSTSTGTRTRTRLTSIPIETLYSISLSTSTTDDDDETTTSISLSRQPLIPTTSSSSSSSSDEVVVVTQFTTITPTLSTTSPSSPTLASSSSSSSGRNPVFPGASSSIPPGNASDNTSSSRTRSGNALSSGAIAGIAIGAIAAAILLGILGFLFCCRKRNNRNGGRHESMYATTRGGGGGGGGGGNHSDEKLATSLFDPAYQHQSYQHQNQQGPSRMRSSAGYGGSSSSAGNGNYNAGLMSAGAAGVGAGAGAGAAHAAYNNNNNSNGNGSGNGNNGRRTSGNNGNYQTGKNKPVPDVPPPVSNLQYTRPAPGTSSISDGAYYAQPQAQRGYNNAPYYGAAGVGGGAAAAAAAAMIGRPSTASPNLATQNARNANAGAGGKRTSAPTPSAYAENVSFPIQTPSERAEALKRSKSIASSVKSIPTEKLGKGSGYASPMPPLDPLGKPLDQKTWRERQSKIKTGFIPDTMLTQEQKLRRDSQIAKLKAIQAGTASSVTPLGKVQEKEEPVETSPLLQQGDQSFERQSSPERISNIYPARHQSLRKDSYSGNNTNKRPESETLLAYASPEPSTSRTNPFPAAAPQPARSPSPPRNTIYPSLPPNSPSRSAALTQSSQGPPPTQPRYELHQPQVQSFNPIRASFITAPQSSLSSSSGGPPPAPSSQAFNTRLPPIPGSRPSSIMTSSTPLPEYRRSSNASYSGTPYAAAAAAGAGGASSQSPNPFFTHANGSGNSFGNSSNGRGTGGPSTSIADDIYGGLTKGLSDRDLLRLSQSQQANAGRK